MITETTEIIADKFSIDDSDFNTEFEVEHILHEKDVKYIYVTSSQYLNDKYNYDEVSGAVANLLNNQKDIYSENKTTNFEILRDTRSDIIDFNMSLPNNPLGLVETYNLIPSKTNISPFNYTSSLINTMRYAGTLSNESKQIAEYINNSSRFESAFNLNTSQSMSDFTGNLISNILTLPYPFCNGDAEVAAKLFRPFFIPYSDSELNDLKEDDRYFLIKFINERYLKDPYMKSIPTNLKTVLHFDTYGILSSSSKRSNHRDGFPPINYITPTTQSSNISFANMTKDSMWITWTRGNGHDHYILLNTINEFTDPINGTDPIADSHYKGSGQQLIYDEYFPQDGAFKVTGLTEGTEYYCRIYDRLGSGTDTGYNLDTMTLNPNGVILKNTSLITTPPTKQASNLNFTNLTSDSVTINWSRGDGEKCMVIFGVQELYDPQDGATNFNFSNVFNYDTANGFDNGQFVYIGTGTTVTVTNLMPNKIYQCRVYEFNDNGNPSNGKYLRTLTNDNNKNVTLSPPIIVPINVPTIQASDIIANVSSNGRVQLSWTRGNGNGCVVILSTFFNGGVWLNGNTDEVDSYPIIADSSISSNVSEIVYSGNENTVILSKVIDGMNYYCLVLEYNTNGTEVKTLKTLNNNSSNTNHFVGVNNTNQSLYPKTQSYNIMTGSSGSDYVDIIWDRGDGNRCILLISDINNPQCPLDGNYIVPNSIYTSGTQVVYNDYHRLTIGGDNNKAKVTVTGLKENVRYYVKAVEYYGAPDIECFYLTNIGFSNPINFTLVSSVKVPEIQISNIAFNTMNIDKMNITWNKGHGEKRLIIMSKSNTINDPKDGEDIIGNSTFGNNNQQVIYNGLGETVSVNGLINGTTYYVKGYEFNGSGANTKYLLENAIDNPKSTTFISGVNPPNEQASGLTFTDITDHAMTVHWERGNGEKCLVVINKNNKFDTPPLNGTDPVKFNNVSSKYDKNLTQQFIYGGTGTSVKVTGLASGTEYYFKVYEYNGNDQFTKYLVNDSNDNPNSEKTTGILISTANGYDYTLEYTGLVSLSNPLIFIDNDTTPITLGDYLRSWYPYNQILQMYDSNSTYMPIFGTNGRYNYHTTSSVHVEDYGLFIKDYYNTYYSEIIKNDTNILLDIFKYIASLSIKYRTYDITALKSFYETSNYYLIPHQTDDTLLLEYSKTGDVLIPNQPNTYTYIGENIYVNNVTNKMILWHGDIYINKQYVESTNANVLYNEYIDGYIQVDRNLLNYNTFMDESMKNDVHDKINTSLNVPYKLYNKFQVFDFCIDSNNTKSITFGMKYNSTIKFLDK
jgi:hypothetical protein